MIEVTNTAASGGIFWWHWIVFGVALILLELAIPAFVLVWFGLGAVAVGLVLLVIALSFSIQLLVFTVLSLALVWLWFKIFKPHMFKTKAGMSQSMLVGEIGMLTKDVAPFQRGTVRLQKPMLGSEVWECVGDIEIKAITSSGEMAASSSLSD